MPPPYELCPPLPSRCAVLPRIDLPLGLTLVPPPSSVDQHDDPCDCLFRLAGMSMPAMGAFAPIELNVDAALGMFKFMEGLPLNVATLNVAGIVEDLKEAAEKIAKLLNLAPFIALPKMVLSVLDFLILVLDCLIQKLTELLELYENLAIKAEFAISLGDPQLALIVDCANDDADRLLDMLLGALGGLGPIIGMLNKLMEMMPGGLSLSFETPPTPDTPLDEIIEAIQGFRDTIKAVRDLIPI